MRTASIYMARSWSPRSINLIALLRDLGTEVAAILKRYS